MVSVDISIGGVVIGALVVVVFMQANNISTIKTQIYSLNKTLDKIALQLGVEALDDIDDEAALESVRELVKEGKKIAAIKKYRISTGEGLKESKEKIDEMYEKLRNQGEI